MTFTFGNLTTTSKSSVMAKATSIKDFILYDHFDPQEEEYYLFLLEGMPETTTEFETLKKRIRENGYVSYIIAAATNTVFIKGDVKQQYDYMKSTASNWKTLINHNGVHVTAIMAFGAALYAINKGTDLIANEFYETRMMKPYYYMGHGFIGNYDTFIFPVDSMDALYPKEFREGCPFEDGEDTTNFKTRFFHEQLKNMKGPKQLPKDMRPYKLVSGRTEEAAEEILKGLINSDVLAWDTETCSESHENGLLWYRKDSHIHCFTFSNDGETGYYIEANLIFRSQKLRDLLCQVMYTCNTMVGANIKFDLHYLMWEMPEFDFYRIRHIDDTGQLIHAINSDVGKGLKAGAFRYTYFGGYDDALDVWKKETKIDDYGLIPFDILSKYATIDAIVTYRIFFAMLDEIDWIDNNFPNEKNIYLPEDKQCTMHSWYTDVMQEAYPKFVLMEHGGMRIDYEYLLEVRQRLQERLPVVAKKLAGIWGVPEDFKFGSAKAVGKQIEKMGWPKIDEAKDGGYAANDDCIQEWKRQNRPGIKDFIEWRLLNSILNTFIGYPMNLKDLKKVIDYEDDGTPIYENPMAIGVKRDENGELPEEYNQNDAKGWEFFITYHPEDKSYRVHQSYAIMGTTTYRCIGNDPNLQNIPVHADIANEVKRCITVPTAKRFTIQSDDGNAYVGGQLDSVEVVGKGRVTLDKITEEDDIIPGSFKPFEWNHMECFEELRDFTPEDEAKDSRNLSFGSELMSEYGDLTNEWRLKYKVPLKEETGSELPVRKVRATIAGTSIPTMRVYLPTRKTKKK